MRTHLLLLVLAALFVGCLRPASAPPAPPGGDSTIAFPQFFAKDAIAVGVPGGPYELDGETLRAIATAADHFLPPDDHPKPCHKKQEAQIYRVIRQGNVFFVDIRENPEYCGRRSPALDSGAKYAISTDGRILRHVLDGAEGGPFDTGKVEPQASDGGFSGELGSSPAFDAIWNPHLSSPPVNPHDGGQPAPDSGFLPSGSPMPDGGHLDAP